ncbi:DUF7344 domain-containing protein [Natrarchaeobius halalkaliphilus]|nr:hypothetical protein [Natrarchaeobius halalkaliphilus]
MLDNHYQSSEYEIRFEDHEERRPELSPGDVFRLLADDHRRYAVQYFATRTSTVATVDDLATFVDDHADDADRRTIEIELVHTHLPKLAASDVILYDSSTKRVRYVGETFLETCLDWASDRDFD